MSVLSWHGPLSGVSRNSISTLSHRSEVTETCPGRENQRILGMRRFPLFSPLKQGTVDGMIGAQLLHQVFNILDHQVHLWRGLDQCSHAALLPLMAQGQHYTTFRILVVVLGGSRAPPGAARWESDGRSGRRTATAKSHWGP